jgi:hypothetical protein
LCSFHSYFWESVAVAHNKSFKFVPGLRPSTGRCSATPLNSDVMCAKSTGSSDAIPSPRYSHFLANTDGIYTHFMTTGSYTIEMPSILRKRLSKFFRRERRQISLQRLAHGNFIFRPCFFVYSFWHMFLMDPFESKNDSYKVCCAFLGIFWAGIRKVRFEKIDEQTMRVVFLART